ncbi:unnamed protein product [Rotaria sp. Silwood2]|nr:unnamed protein product [Rotaria sp. Silwood2]CAF4707099.1 unnamed protein product [Rotaria sp. Silwood2]
MAEQNDQSFKNIEIIWVDCDPNIYDSTILFRNENWKVWCFNATRDATEALQTDQISPANVRCIITSMMERTGGRERGLRNGLEMLDDMKLIWKRNKLSCSPLIAIISRKTDVQKCKEHGAEIVVIGDRAKLQRDIITRLKQSSDIYYRLQWRDPSLLPCENLRDIAHKFLSTLQLDPSYLDPFADRCFCVSCEPRQISERSGEKYALPTGYYRYGIAIRREFTDKRVYIEDWPVAFHGTRKDCVKSIICHRRIMFPNDILDDGTKLPVRHNQCWAKEVAPGAESVIYLSPTIKYSEHDVYAPPIGFEGYSIKLVFQCRVKPNSFRKFPETLGRGNSKFDPAFENDEIEWVTAERTAVVPYGLLIGVFGGSITH